MASKTFFEKFIHCRLFTIKTDVSVCKNLGKSSGERRNRRNRQWPEYFCDGDMSRVQPGNRGEL